MSALIHRRRFLSAGAAGLLATGFATRTSAFEDCGEFTPRPDDPDATVFEAARRRFLFPTDVTYGNTGTLGACPCDVMEAYVNGLETLERELPDWPYFQADGEPLTGYQELRGFRGEIGAFINADIDEVALTQNATMGMSFIANGLELNTGDEVITTDQEHSGGIGGWRLRAKRSGIIVNELPLDSALDEGPEAVVDLFAQAITPRTRVAMWSHITSAFGVVMPTRRLCDLVRTHGVLSVVDGAQAVGQVEVDMDELGCDAYVASPHKWLLAPKGTGFFYLRGDVAPRIWGTLAGSHFDDWDAGAFRFMQFGTGSLPLVHGLSAALRFINTLGIERIERWDRGLTQRLRGGLATIPAVRLTSPADQRFAAAITTFRVEGRTARELQNALWEQKIRVRAQNDRNGVRFCTHLYVAPSDIDRALDVVSGLA